MHIKFPVVPACCCSKTAMVIGEKTSGNIVSLSIELSDIENIEIVFGIFLVAHSELKLHYTTVNTELEHREYRVHMVFHLYPVMGNAYRCDIYVKIVRTGPPKKN